MPLFESFDVDLTTVGKAIADHWEGIAIDSFQLLKSSQNHTYRCDLNGNSVILRITPYSPWKYDQITLEMEFLDYLSSHKLSLCPSIKPTTVSSVIIQDKTLSPTSFIIVKVSDELSLCICAYQYAKGNSIDFSQYDWLLDETKIDQLGQWFGTFHNLSQQYTQEKLQIDPHFFDGINTYATNLSNTLLNIELHQDDLLTKENTLYYGLSHGDVNVSNYFLNDDKYPIMFDWDQIQLGWYLFDLAQPIWGVIVAIYANLTKSQLPKEVEEIKNAPLYYAQKLVQGYIKTRQCDNQDAIFNFDRLKRMLVLRREQYHKFCSKAVIELDQIDGPLNLMKSFCQSIDDWLSQGNCDIDLIMGDSFDF